MASTPPATGRPALVVLGPPGGGADLVARVLQAAGAATPGEAAGGLADWTAQALAARGSHADDLFGPRRAAEVGDADEVDDLARRLGSVAGEGGPPPLFCEPGADFLAGTWAAATRRAGLRPVFVIAVTDPAVSAASLKTEHGFTRARGLLLWTSHMLRAERATRGERRVFIDLGRLHDDPERELDRIERALGAALPRRSWDAAAEIEDLLHAEPRPPASAAPPDALAPVSTLHGHLQAAAQDAPENADVAAEVAGWFDGLEQAVAPVLKELERELRRRSSGAQTAGALQPPPAAVPLAPAEPEGAGENTRRLEELDQALKAARRDLAEALDRAHAQEAQASIAEAQVAVARRRASEAEEVLNGRLLEAQTHEREAREALAVVIAGREAAEVREREAVSAMREAAAAALETAVDQARRHAELQLSEIREALAVTGVSNLAAQARVRELETRLAEAEAERRRRWWLAPFRRR